MLIKFMEFVAAENNLWSSSLNTLIGNENLSCAFERPVKD